MGSKLYILSSLCLFRLRTELAKLRKMYEDQTEKAKSEFMYLHSNKVLMNNQITPRLMKTFKENYTVVTFDSQ